MAQVARKIGLIRAFVPTCFAVLIFIELSTGRLLEVALLLLDYNFLVSRRGSFATLLFTALIFHIFNIVVGGRIPLQGTSLHERGLLPARFFLFRVILIGGEIRFSKLDSVPGSL